MSGVNGALSVAHGFLSQKKKNGRDNAILTYQSTNKEAYPVTAYGRKKKVFCYVGTSITTQKPSAGQKRVGCSHKFR